MNNENKISNETKLYGFIGEHAGASRFSAIINKKFKNDADDIMMIPMNIREDDLYFTLSNMKNSHVNGAIISSEYMNDIIDVLDESSQIVKRSGMCDIVFKENSSLRGDISKRYRRIQDSYYWYKSTGKSIFIFSLWI